MIGTIDVIHDSFSKLVAVIKNLHKVKMARVYVFLYEDGTQRSFANLSGEEVDSIETVLSHYGNLNTDPEPGTEVKYAVIEGEGIPLNKRIEIHPVSSGSDKWGRVEVEFRNTTGGRRKKTRGKSKRRVRKTRRHRKVRYI